MPRHGRASGAAPGRISLLTAFQKPSTTDYGRGADALQTPLATEEAPADAVQATREDRLETAGLGSRKLP